MLDICCIPKKIFNFLLFQRTFIIITTHSPAWARWYSPVSISFSVFYVQLNFQILLFILLLTIGNRTLYEYICVYLYVAVLTLRNVMTHYVRYNKNKTAESLIQISE